MSSFQDFWNAQEDSAQQTQDLPKAQISPTVLCAQLSSGISGVTTSVLFNTKQQKIDKFSEDVSRYVTSYEVIATVSEKVGEPRPEETEEKFVERASNLLREILYDKFKV